MHSYGLIDYNLNYQAASSVVQSWVGGGTATGPGTVGPSCWLETAFQERFGSAKATDSDAEAPALKAFLGAKARSRLQEINELVQKPEFLRSNRLRLFFLDVRGLEVFRQRGLDEACGGIKRDGAPDELEAARESLWLGPGRAY